MKICRQAGGEAGRQRRSRGRGCGRTLAGGGHRCGGSEAAAAGHRLPHLLERRGWFDLEAHLSAVLQFENKSWSSNKVATRVAACAWRRLAAAALHNETRESGASPTPASGS